MALEKYQPTFFYSSHLLTKILYYTVQFISNMASKNVWKEALWKAPIKALKINDKAPLTNLWLMRVSE